MFAGKHEHFNGKDGGVFRRIKGGVEYEAIQKVFDCNGRCLCGGVYARRL